MSKAGDKLPARPRVRRGNADDAQQLRHDLLGAALELFEQGGLDAVSVRAVAARVGVSHMAMYRYFANKRELLAGLSELAMRAAIRQVREASQATGDARQRYGAAMAAYIDYWQRNPEQYCLAYGFSSLHEIAEPAPKLARHAGYEEGLELWRSLVGALADAIGAPPQRVKLAQDLGIAMMLGYMHGVFALRRYPWSKEPGFRAAYLAQLQQAVERCLLGSP